MCLQMQTGDAMTKEKFNKIVYVLLMVVSLILIIHSLIEDSQYKIANLLTYVGLFLIGAYPLYLSLKNNRKKRN